MVFLKSQERGKCFIEYIPVEYAWNPIVAEGYMYINCLWVAGSFKGHGYATDLLNACIEDSKSKGKKGLCILSSKRKKTFLADSKFLKHKGFDVCDEADNGIQLWFLPFDKNALLPKFKADSKFLKHKGFDVCDEADNGIQLWFLPFDKNALLPKFKACAKHPRIDEMGYVLYYTSQCPFNAKYVPIIEEIAKEKGVQFKSIHLQSKEQAQNAPTPITTYALFYNGEYLTNEQMNDKKFLKLLAK